MARLEASTIPELIQTKQGNSPKTHQAKRRELTQAVKHQRLIRLHTLPVLDRSEFRSEHRDFLSWVQNDIALPEDKYKLFEAMFTAPVCTGELTESIHSEFEKIFEGEDAFIKPEFENPDLEQDADEYRKALGDEDRFRTEGMEQLKTGINSILIVDLPEETEGNNAEPYFYWLDIENVIDIELSRVRSVKIGEEKMDLFKVEYIVFEEGDKKVAVFDEEYYRLYQIDDNGTPVLIKEVPHTIYDASGKVIEGLGQCPARYFWTTSLHSSNPYVKASPISNSLGELKTLLWYKTAQKCSDAVAPFPIYSAMKGVCKYTNEQGSSCVSGYTDWTEMAEGHEPIIKKVKCPSCNGKKLVGPGTLVHYPAPDGQENIADLRNPVQVLYPERDALDYIDERIDSMEDDIFYNCTGWGGDSGQNNTQAKNQDQIAAGFESKTTVLNRIKTNFELAHTWVLDSVFKLRYGKAYKGLALSYGAKFYLKDSDAKLEEYEKKKAAGMPHYELQKDREELSYYQHRSNPDMRERDRILMHLEPYPDKTIEELLLLKEKAPMFIDDEKFIIKLNFNELIKRFEREQMSILTFGMLLEFDKKIEIIKDTLKTYIQDELTRAKTIEAERNLGTEENLPTGRNRGNDAGQRGQQLPVAS